MMFIFCAVIPVGCLNKFIARIFRVMPQLLLSSVSSTIIFCLFADDKLMMRNVKRLLRRLQRRSSFNQSKRSTLIDYSSQCDPQRSHPPVSGLTLTKTYVPCHSKHQYYQCPSLNGYLDGLLQFLCGSMSPRL